ncbi:MAG: hypothetical protein ONA69_09240 [candidate division KSB1 bacterium]|nr:hypothetical protein [candidate division KSB1 bacterium]
MSVVVRPMKDELTAVSPANIGAVLMEISNHTPYEEFEERIQLPDNWELVSHQSILYLRPNDRNVKLLSFAVPIGTAAGNYQIHYHIYSRQFPEINDRYDFNVVVLPQNRLSIKIMQAKSFVLAGEEFLGTAALYNEGNQELKILLETTKGYIAGESSFFLSPNSGRNIEIRLPTDRNLRHHQYETIILTARSEDGKAYEEAVFRFEIIPISGPQADSYFRLPTTIFLNYLNFRNSIQGADGFQGGVEIKGALDEKGNHHLQLKMRGPDRFNLSPLGQRDEYSVNYQHPNGVIKLGDYFFESSYLTEFSRYGRGFEVNYHLNRLSFGGFYLQPRFYKKIQEETALFVRYNLRDNLSFRLNFLEKRTQKSHSLLSMEI